MSRIAALATAAFTALWRTIGKPRVAVIEPLTNWTLPAGYRYEPAIDALTDRDGRAITDPAALAALWRAFEVPAIPERTLERAFDVTVGGVVQTGNTGYVVPWEHKPLLDAAWGVQDAAGALWRVTRVQADLTGAPVTVILEPR